MRPHHHPEGNLWLDRDEQLWRCDAIRGNCTWTRPWEPFDDCLIYGVLHEGHAAPMVRSMAPDFADLVCPVCGAPACVLRPALRVVS